MNSVPSWVGVLPHILAFLNACALLLVVAGFLAIRSGKPERHRPIMIPALATSVIFLVIYGTYHAHVGNVKFAGEGNIRLVYFALLITHVIMAAINLPMVIMTAWRALTQRLDAHRRLAPYTAFVWIYVSLSGLVVYWLAFHVYVSVVIVDGSRFG
ncbi:MAG: DUF420 domain-containing protein [Magnetococcales bacterium]|nr:DUF420 domain-containing protein [Magnetococcales bacterium]